MTELRTIPPNLDDIMAAIDERDRGAKLLPQNVVRWDTALAAEVRRLRVMLAEKEASNA